MLLRDLVSIYIELDVRDGKDHEGATRLWQQEIAWAEGWAEGEIEVCSPPRCLLIHLGIDRGEAYIRDYAAAHNLYADMPGHTDAQALIDACWLISMEQRSQPSLTVMRSGDVDTVRCLEHMILWHVEFLFSKEDLDSRRATTRWRLDLVGDGLQPIYFDFFNDHKDCPCDRAFETIHLTRYARLLEEMLADIIDQRIRCQP